MIETVVQPDGFVAAAHVHPSQTERFAVAEGTLGSEGRRQGEDPEPRRRRDRRARPGAQVLERGRRAGPVRLRGAAGASVRVAARDDVRPRRRRQDEPEGDAEPAAARGDREGALRHRSASLPARLDAGRGLAVGSPLGRLLGYEATYEGEDEKVRGGSRRRVAQNGNTRDRPLLGPVPSLCSARAASRAGRSTRLRTSRCRPARRSTTGSGSGTASRRSP